MSVALAWAAFFGLLFGVGLWVIMLVIPRWGRVSLSEQVAPYVADISAQAFADVTRRSHHPLAFLGRSHSPASLLVQRLTDLMPASTPGEQVALRQAGSPMTLEEFRARRAVWLMGGLVVGLVLDVIITFLVPFTLIALLVIPLVTSVAGYLSCELLLKRLARLRVDSVCEQIPAVWEFLALAVSAGETLTDALRRIGQIGHGALIEELKSVVSRVELGVPVGFALQELSAELHIPALGRGVEQLISTLDRGTPIVTVLRDQADDAREDAKRRLLEAAGNKEVAMLVPLVFLILPITIVFAVFPGLVVIQAGF